VARRARLDDPWFFDVEFGRPAFLRYHIPRTLVSLSLRHSFVEFRSFNVSNRRLGGTFR
jgi:hypothetical protein